MQWLLYLPQPPRTQFQVFRQLYPKPPAASQRPAPSKVLLPSADLVSPSSTLNRSPYCSHGLIRPQRTPPQPTPPHTIFPRTQIHIEQPEQTKGGLFRGKDKDGKEFICLMFHRFSPFEISILKNIEKNVQIISASFDYQKLDTSTYLLPWSRNRIISAP